MPPSPDVHVADRKIAELRVHRNHISAFEAKTFILTSPITTAMYITVAAQEVNVHYAAWSRPSERLSSDWCGKTERQVTELSLRSAMSISCVARESFFLSMDTPAYQSR